MIASQPVRLVLVVSAPSGAGKTTLCERLLNEFPTLEYSVSCTTRAPREGEVDGEDYHFIDEKAFQTEQKENAFLESACVHGNRYGTRRRDLERALAAGRDVLLDIDVQGAAQLRNALRDGVQGGLLPRGYVDLFIAPPSMEVLEQRLRGRAQDDDATIDLRLAVARDEINQWPAYRYLVINDDLDLAYRQLRSVYIAEHCAVARLEQGS